MEYVAKMMQVVTRARANTCHLKTGRNHWDWTECEDRSAKGLQRLLRQRIRELQAARKQSTETYQSPPHTTASLFSTRTRDTTYHSIHLNNNDGVNSTIESTNVSNQDTTAYHDVKTSKDKIFELDVYRRDNQTLLEHWTIQYTPK
jgi:hypothetical protein